jgi:hypothetical protein
MSIPSIAGVARVPSSTVDTTAAGGGNVHQSSADAANRATSTAATVEAVGYKTLTPPRFPWLSRLSEQLDSVAKQKPAFPSAPVLGDNVDKSA